MDIQFLSFQKEYWDSPWRNRHYFLWELSKIHPVFFLSPPFYIRDLISNSKRLKTSLPEHTMIKTGLYSYVPPSFLPFNYKMPTLNKFIRKVREHRIRHFLKKDEFYNPVLLIWHPSFADMIDLFKENLVIYYKYDNYAGFEDGIETKDDTKEIALLERADLIYVVSRGLYELHKDYKSKMRILPNGVDFDRFFKISVFDEPLPKDILTIPEPRIGYVGVINDKVDLNLLEQISLAKPEWSIVLVGPNHIRSDESKKILQRLQNRSNVYFLGSKSASDVPYYIKGINVCIICNLMNNWTYYTYPLKIHEYLAMGKPIVATDMPAVREFEDIVSIPRKTDEWIQAIEANLNKEESGREIRIQTAKQNSWQNRVNIFLQDIYNFLL